MYHPFAFNKQDIRPALLTSAYIDVLIIGGGGAGGFLVGGGGGAGGYIAAGSGIGNSGGGQSAVSVFTASMGTPYNLYVGAGAPAYSASGGTFPLSGNGSPTGFATNTVNYVALGGGRGSHGYNHTADEPAYRNGSDGGSGGGGASWSQTNGTGSASGSGGLASPTGPIYGYDGGSGSISSALLYRRGGGGGGAGAVGSHADNTSTGTNVAGGNGGNGVESSITGESIYRAGGGGGGSTRVNNTPPGGTGGLGGGGNGATGTGVGGNGSAYSGSGGGGASNTGYSGGSGGSGAIIIRYNRNDITHSVSAGVTIISETIPYNGAYIVLVLAGGTQQTPENITFSAIT